MIKSSINQKVAYALVRVSTSAQSTDSQANDIVKVANRMGYTIEPDNIFEEVRSGLDEDYNEDRESIKRLKNAIQAKKPDAIFCWELSRLTRTPDKVEKYIYELSLQPQIPLYIYKFGKEGIWTMENGRILTENTKAIRACADAVYDELMAIKERTMRGRDDKAREGKYVGHVADGYIANRDGTFSIDEVRRPDIVKIFELYANHNYSTDEISAILNAEQVKTATHYRATSDLFPNYKPIIVAKYKTGAKDVDRTKMMWKGELVSQVLNNTWYRGFRKYHNDEYQVPPIIEDQEILSKVDDKLRTSRVSQHKTNAKNPHLLSGLIFCGKCKRVMYGHYTGLNNHYYCSSIESGKKCGGRGIKKENIEAIIIDRIRHWAVLDIFRMDSTSVFAEIFNNNDKITEYEELIKTCDALIGKANFIIEDSKAIIRRYVDAMGTTDNKDLISQFQSKISQAYSTIEREEKNIVIQSGKKRNYEKQIKNVRGISSSIKRIQTATNPNDYQEVIGSVIDRVEVYNADASTSIIRIQYVNGMSEDVIYCYRKLKENYISLSKPGLYYDTEQNLICFPDKNLILSLNIGTPIGYSKLKDNKPAKSGTHNTMNSIMTIEKSEREQYQEQDRIISVSTDCAISVSEYIGIVLDKARGEMMAFDGSVVQTEKAIKQKEFQKEYDRSKRTGKPTGLPRLDPDFDNESIQIECKHLYNRIYKIKKNKSMSAEDKEAKIAEIKEQLAVLGAKKKYLTRKEQEERYLN